MGWYMCRCVLCTIWGRETRSTQTHETDPWNRPMRMEQTRAWNRPMEQTHGADPWNRPMEQTYGTDTADYTNTAYTLGMLQYACTHDTITPVVLLVSMAVQPMHEYTHMHPNHTPAPIVPPKIHIHTVQHLKYIVLSMYPLHLTKSRWHSMVQLQHVPIRAKHTY